MTPKDVDSTAKKAVIDAAYSPTLIAQNLRSDYASSGKEPIVKALEGIQQLAEYLSNQDTSLQETLDFVARLIYKHLSIKEITIGLKSPKDGLFRYYAMYGLTEKSWQAHKPLEYTASEFSSSSKYKGTSLSRKTILFLVEDRPYDDDELKTFGWYISGQQSRRTLSDSIEGDYLDILMLDRNNENIGWIEIGGTWDGKLPNGRTIRALETIATILSIHLPRLLSDQVG